MQHSLRILVNTIFSYARIAVHAIVALLVTRIALNALGVDAFGIYNLIAGVVAMLTFIDGALSFSAQRYFSIAIGGKDIERLNKCFSTSMAIHTILGIVLLLLLLMVQPLLFDGFLNIDPQQTSAARTVYAIMVASTSINVLFIPYKALMNAYEDIAALSVFAVLSYVVQLLAAVVLLFIDNYRLEVFTAITAASILITVVMSLAWCKRNYRDVHGFALSRIDRRELRSMTSFAAWNTFGTFATIVRNQGIAVVLNIFFGVVANAAYGIANQVNSLVLSFATSLTIVFTPMIVEARGAGNDRRMISTAVFSSKMSLLLSTLLGLPILLFLNPILSLWIGEIPENTEIFCQYIIIAFLVGQTHPGLHRAILSVGNIKGYQLWYGLSMIAILPAGIMLFRWGYPPVAIFIAMIVSQLAVMTVTVYYARRLCGLPTKAFISDIVKCGISFAALVVAGYCATPACERLGIWACATLACALCSLYAAVFVKFTLDSNERHNLTELFNSLVSKARR